MQLSKYILSVASGELGEKAKRQTKTNKIKPERNDVRLKDSRIKLRDYLKTIATKRGIIDGYSFAKMGKGARLTGPTVSKHLRRMAEQGDIKILRERINAPLRFKLLYK